MVVFVECKHARDLASGLDWTGTPKLECCTLEPLQCNLTLESSRLHGDLPGRCYDKKILVYVLMNLFYNNGPPGHREVPTDADECPSCMIRSHRQRVVLCTGSEHRRQHGAIVGISPPESLER